MGEKNHQNFTRHNPVSEVIFRIYKEFKKLNFKETNNPIKIEAWV